MSGAHPRGILMGSRATDIKRVLLVDDDANIRFITEMSLQGLTDWEITLAGTAQEALSAVTQVKPDLALLDVMMPGMDGVTLLRKMREQVDEAHMPLVIFMTAKVQTQEIEAYKNLGAVGVITKPFDPMKLAEQIEGILNTA